MLSFFEYQFFLSRFLHRTFLMCLQTRFTHVLGNFSISPKLSILHGIYPLHCGHFWAFSKSFHFSNSSCFFQPFFAQNNSNVFEETSLVCLRQCNFLTQTEYFAWAIALALWPFFTIFKMLSFFEYKFFFKAFFCIEQLYCVWRHVLRMLQAILVFDPN